MKTIKFCFFLMCFLCANIHANQMEISNDSDHLVTITDIRDGYFAAKGYYYPVDKELIPLFINKDDKYILSNEEIHPIGKDTYSTMTLTSLANNQSFDFKSLPVTTGRSEIFTLFERSRSIEPNTQTEEYRCRFDENCYRTFPVWDVVIEYEVQFEYEAQFKNETFYTLKIAKRERDENAAIEFFNHFNIEVKDEIAWGSEVLKSIEETIYGAPRYYGPTKISRNGKELQELIGCVEVRGQKRTPHTFMYNWTAPQVFKINGYYYQFDPRSLDFNLPEFGGFLILASQEIEYLSYNDYRVKIGVVSPTSQRIYYLTTLLSNDEKFSEIDQVVEESSSDRNRMKLTVYLKDGLTYHISLNSTVGKDAVQPGDQIFWDFSKLGYPYWNYSHWVCNPVRELTNVDFRDSYILRNGQSVNLPELEIKGQLRTMNASLSKIRFPDGTCP